MNAIAPRMLPLAGVELGGTKCICTLGRGAEGIEDQVVLPTEDPDGTLSAIAEQLRRWSRGRGFAALGIGSFGPLALDAGSPDFGHIQQTAKPGWSGAPVLVRIAEPFGVPVLLDTDVNAAALAERNWGAGRDTQGFAYVTVGTGVGVGFASAAGQESHAHAEFGHIRVVRHARDHRRSVCPFHEDCVEGLASGKAITQGLSRDKVAALTPEDPRWEAPLAYLGQLCHAILCATGVSRIVFGGGAMTAQPTLIARIEAEMRDSLNGYLALPAAPMLVPAALGDQAGPLGSLALAESALQQERPSTCQASGHG